MATLSDPLSERGAARAEELLAERRAALARRTDRMFICLMTMQWVIGIVFAVWISPLTWAGAFSRTHIHVLAAVFLGGLITSLPVVLAFRRPGAALTRHAIAAGQMLTSALLIHLTGGRIETHFHVFGSLAFLAFYRDWRVLVTASAIVILDHGLRGVFWPQSVYGIGFIQPWRFLEHAAWVFFEAAFLAYSIRQSLGEMRDAAARQAQLEEVNELIERKVTERTRELARANEELEAFSYSASHDLRAPLRHLEGFSAILEESFGRKLDPENRAHLARIRTAAKNMSRLIDSMLELARVTRCELRRAEVDLTLQARLIVDDMRQAAPERAVKVTIAPHLTAQGDEDLLRIALTNLLSNSWKFVSSQEGAEIELGSALAPEGTVYFVRDNGAGFNMAYSRKLFTPFQKLHRPGEFAGSGIGLATVKRIVERHSGRVWAEGAVGGGATFFFTLPAPEATAIIGGCPPRSEAIPTPVRPRPPAPA
ncbi:MAG: histidine kinase [Elusimicrobia bacterium]|nr:histidine kinase [Elusimicrobiota bacterium]